MMRSLFCILEWFLEVEGVSWMMFVCIGCICLCCGILIVWRI